MRNPDYPQKELSPEAKSKFDEIRKRFLGAKFTVEEAGLLGSGVLDELMNNKIKWTGETNEKGIMLIEIIE